MVLNKHPVFMVSKDKYHSLLFWFSSTKNDSSLFVKFYTNSKLLVLICVGNIIIIVTSSYSLFLYFKTILSSKILEICITHWHYWSYLDKRWKHSFISNQIHRRPFTNKNMLASKPQPTLMISSTRFALNVTTAIQDISMYRSIVGSMQHIIFIRPELAYCVNKFCRFMHQSQEHHWKVMKRILRHLSTILHHGIFLHKCSNLQLLAMLTGILTRGI